MKQPTGTTMCGVLLLHGKTFGRSSSGRLLYLCIPFDKLVAPVVVPCDVDIGFSKVVVNRYIAFTMASAEPGGGILQGVCVQTFGPVTSLTAYCDYLLWAYGLYPRVKQDLPLLLSVGTPLPLSVGTPFVFTMDPAGAECFDDALSLWFDAVSQLWVVDVYVANVVDAVFSVDKTSDAVFSVDKTKGCWPSNIYLPWGKRLSMFPTGWVRGVSLHSGERRAAVRLRCRFAWCDDGVPALVDSSLSTVDDLVVHVRGVYGTPLDDPSFARLMDLTGALLEEGHCDPWFVGGGVASDHRRMVSYWMVRMNHAVMDRLMGSPAFLRVHASSPSLHEAFVADCGDTAGPYQFSTVVAGSYLSCTSPLRRRVDFMNQTLLVSVLRGGAPVDGLVSAWVNDLESFNASCRAVAKMSAQLRLLYAVDDGLACTTGVVVGCGHGDGSGKYRLFLPSLRVFVSARLEPALLDIGSSHSFRLFSFSREHDVRRKVRLSLV